MMCDECGSSNAEGIDPADCGLEEYNRRDEKCMDCGEVFGMSDQEDLRNLPRL
jgi:ribosomal protein L37E